MNWRGWLASYGTGCAAMLGYCGEWAWAVMTVIIALLPVAVWVRGEFAATAALMRERPEDPPAMTPAEAAAVFTGLARDIDADLAGGVPAKAVAQAAADRARSYGREVRAAARVPLPRPPAELQPRLAEFPRWREPAFRRPVKVRVRTATPQATPAATRPEPGRRPVPR